MDIKDLRAMSADDLRQQLTKSGERLFRVRFQKSMGNLEGVRSLREERRTIAKVKTILRERETGAVVSKKGETR